MARPTDHGGDRPPTTDTPGDEPGESAGPDADGLDDAVAGLDALLQSDSPEHPDAGVGDLGEVLVVDDDPVRAAQGERDEYRDALQRLKAEFDNYRKRTIKAEAETRERASEALVVALLPVLDACDAAIVHDAADVGPISKMLLETLQKQGLEPMVVEGQPFDPLQHEAVLHEPGDGGESVVVESMRTGYLWKGRVLRPAMVKVRG
jgi:molecular chaperone GrpE